MPMTLYTGRMTFGQRLMNTIPVIATSFLVHLIHPSNVFGNISPELSKYEVIDLVTKAELYLENTDMVLNDLKPVMPNFIQIGGISARPPSPLPAKLEKFIHEADHGVILFTFGSVARNVPAYLIDTIKSALIQLPQRVIMKVDKESIDGNILSTSWVPQNNILGNNKTRLFISHCGNNGHFEGLFHGVPILCIPLFGDQFWNAKRITQHGVGLTVDRTTLTADILLASVKEILQNDTYSKTMKRASEIFRDRPETAQQRGARAIEHVIKYGGKHLRPHSADMPNYQVMMLDIWGTLFLMSSALTYGTYRLLRLCCRKCCGRKLKKD